MLELNFSFWLIAFLPILVLVVTLLGRNWSAPKAGTAAWITAAILGLFFFGADWFILGIACAKGLSLSLFVLLIIWTSVFLYNLIDRLGAIGVVGRAMIIMVGSRLGQALLLAWGFSGFIQGIAGFGLPVAVVAPLMLMVGFPPIMAAVSVLVGHAWAVSFGSMGSSYYTIELVTGLPGEILGPIMAILFALPVIATGFAVAHMEGGWQGTRKGALAIIITGVAMSFFMWLMAFYKAGQIASVVSGLVGCASIWLLSKTPLLRGKGEGELASNPEITDKGMNFHIAFLPYYLMIFLTIISQLPLIKTIGNHLYFGIDYPRLETSLGYVVEPVKAYAKISLINHPAPIILVATLLTFLAFIGLGLWKGGAGVAALKITVKQCVPTSMGMITMVMMALIMTNTGMTEVLAGGIARVTGAAFPIFSPYIGVLGCFMTGSNTSSNVMFGTLQMETARSLGISTPIIAAVQSIGGSLGSAIAPAKVLIGSALVGLVGREATVMRKALPYCLLIVLLVGLEAWLAVYIFS